jgi:hypothetical protein
VAGVAVLGDTNCERVTFSLGINISLSCPPLALDCKKTKTDFRLKLQRERETYGRTNYTKPSKASLE